MEEASRIMAILYFISGAMMVAAALASTEIIMGAFIFFLGIYIIYMGCDLFKVAKQWGEREQTEIYTDQY